MCVCRNCRDNVVAEKSLQQLKQEQDRLCTYSTRHDVRRDVSDYVEMFYNRKRKHTNIGMRRPLTLKSDSKNGTWQVSSKLGAPHAKVGAKSALVHLLVSS